MAGMRRRARIAGRPAHLQRHGHHVHGHVVGGVSVGATGHPQTVGLGHGAAQGGAAGAGLHDLVSAAPSA